MPIQGVQTVEVEKEKSATIFLDPMGGPKKFPGQASILTGLESGGDVQRRWGPRIPVMSSLI
jgi:hypothetical protein